MMRTLRKLWVRGFQRDKFQIVKREDGVFLVNYKNYIDRKIMIDGAYERTQLARLAEFATKIQAAHFFDIGANIGVYSVRMARVPTIRHIHSFEPMPANRNQLHANVLLNGLNDIVTIHPFALSNEDGTSTFLQNKGNSTGRSRIKATNTSKIDAEKFIEVEIETRKFDPLFTLTNQRVAMKIDVEEQERKVLEGMPSFLRNNTCVIQMEAYAGAAGSTDKFLLDQGYSVIETIHSDRYYSNIPELLV